MIFYGPRATALNTHLSIIATPGVAMTPKAASTEFLLPELMKKDLNRPISHGTERGAEQHHRHRNQYDCDGGGAGGAIGHRSRRLESIVRNVAAAKQESYGERIDLIVDSVSTSGGDAPSDLSTSDVEIVSETTMHTTTINDSESDDDTEFPTKNTNQVWGGSDLSTLIFGEGYPHELVSAAYRAGEYAPHSVPTSFESTVTTCPTVDLLQNDIKFQVDIAPPASVTRWTFKVPFNALTHIGLTASTIRLGFAVNVTISFVDTKKKTKHFDCDGSATNCSWTCGSYNIIIFVCG